MQSRMIFDPRDFGLVSDPSHPDFEDIDALRDAWKKWCKISMSPQLMLATGHYDIDYDDFYTPFELEVKRVVYGEEHVNNIMFMSFLKKLEALD